MPREDGLEWSGQSVVLLAEASTTDAITSREAARRKTGLYREVPRIALTRRD